VPLLQKTDLATHTKRFVIIGTLAIIGLLGAVTALVIHMGIHYSSTKEVPAHIRLNHADLAQIQSLQGAKTFAAVAAEATASPNTIIVQPTATPTSP
jgi:preprotein translocase subunit SecF